MTWASLVFALTHLIGGKGSLLRRVVGLSPHELYFAIMGAHWTVKLSTMRVHLA